MKLYATTTSERASKGQGGNEFLNIEVKGEGGAVLLSLTFEPTPEGVKMSGYSEHYHGIGPDGVKRRSERFLSEEWTRPHRCMGCHKSVAEILACDECGKEIEKGERQKGECNHACITSHNNIETCDQCGHTAGVIE